MMDAYSIEEEQSNSVMSIYELLNAVSTELRLEPVMPPFLVPYYYCDNAEDGGISAFQICRGGHVTIHTFPYRSCYFVDILTDNFFSAGTAEGLFKTRLFADSVHSSMVDRRMIYEAADAAVDERRDFGPHYMIEVTDADMSFEWIYTWLDNIAEKINMLPISRPYVVTDARENPAFISGILVVAQSHIAVHYNVEERTALIDIFSCEFLEDEKISALLTECFGERVRCKLISRGSKHKYQYKRKSARIAVCRKWRENI